MVLQAYIDESVSAPGREGYLVLAGHVATAENWGHLAREWEQLLPLAKLGPNGRRRFKLSEMGSSPASLADIAAFYRVIEEYVAMSISVAIRKSDLERARKRVSVVGYQITEWAEFDSPYQYAFGLLMDAFHLRRHLLTPELPLDETVDFIFDEHSEKRVILSAWDDYVRSRTSKHGMRLGATPRFENDDRFLPLQAADLWAGAVRRWKEVGDDGTKLANSDFGAWSAHRKDHLKAHIEMNADQITDHLLSAIRDQVPESFTYDVDL